MALRVPPSACQLKYGDAAGAIVGQEDCLYLSIWAPRFEAADAPSKRVPVMVWFHGGGNRIGNGAEQCGGRLAASQDMIVVAVNYRLDFFGWFVHRTLTEDGSAEERSGNFGTLDQIHALEWVRDNIANFGGDPDNVTIFGESAGGHNVLALLQSPSAAGLFHRAMPMSAASYQLMSVPHAENLIDDPVPGHPISSGEILLALLIRQEGCRDRAAARACLDKLSDREIADYLRARSYRELLDAVDLCRQHSARIGSPEAETSWARDNNPLLFDDGSVISRNWHNKVPVLIGSTRYEDRVFLSDDPRHVTIENGKWQLKDRSWYVILSDYLGACYKLNAVDEKAARFSARGSAVYAYRFDWDELAIPAGETDYRDLRGAEHGSEMPLFFGTPDLGEDFLALQLHYDESDGSSFQQLSAAMMSYVAAFAAQGAPGSGRAGDLPIWEDWKGGDFLILDSPTKGGIRMAAERLDKDLIIERIGKDPRLAAPGARARLVEDFRAYFINRFSEDDLRRIAAQGAPTEAARRQA